MTSSMASSKPAPLPPFRPSLVKQKLPFEQFDSIQRLLCAQIQLLLQNSPSPSTVLAFLQAYLSDVAQDYLKSLSTAPVVDSASPNTTPLRQQVLALLSHLADHHPKSITQAILIDTVIVYGPKNATHVKRFLTDLLGRREPQFKTAIATSFSRMLSELINSTINTIAGVRRVAHILAAVVRTVVPAILDELIDGKPTINDMATIYDRNLPALLLSVKLDDVPLSSGARSWLQTKVDLLDSFHILVEHVLASERHLESGIALLFDLTSVEVDVAEQSPFIHFPLIADYQHQFDLAQRLKSLSATHDDPRLDVLIAQIANLAPADPNELGPLSLLLETPATNNIAFYGASGGRKGKGKAAPVDEGVEDAITQILSILPDQDPDFLRRCLAHSTFIGSDRTEKLMAALLEGNVPAELMMDETSDPSANEPSHQLLSTDDGKGKEKEKEYKYTKGRQNIFNDQPFDISALRIGKKRDDADLMMQDKSWMIDMKADILRRAQESSDDEEEEAEYDAYGEKIVRKKRLEPFDDDDWDGLDEGLTSVRVAGADDESDGQEDIAQQTDQIQKILELAYLKDPKLFDRDAATRRSAQRTDLKKQTKWSDEQIEGWRIMLDRNPREKEKILRKHEFSGNKLLTPDDRGEDNGEGEAENDDPTPGPSRGRGGRGRGSGRGRGGRGGGDGGDGTARGRAWKDKNKARHGNHDRKRGHDKKMARAG